MRIQKQASLVGPNIYAPVSVRRVALEVGGSGPDPTADSAAAAREALCDLLPGLRGNRLVVASEAQDAAVVAATLVAVCALALQRELGFAVEVAAVGRSPEAGVYHLTYEYRDPAHRALAASAAVTLVEAALAADRADPSDLAAVLDAQLERLRARTYGVVTRRLLWAAERRGIPWSRVPQMPGVLRLGQGHKQTQFQGTYTSETPWLASIKSTNKAGASNLLASHGLPVPRHVLVREADEAVEAAERLGYPVVVKPNTTDMGTAVTIGIESEAALRVAFAEAREHGDVLVEQQIVGKDHRITVIKGRMVAAGRNMTARVIGDGTSSIRDLIARENNGPLRGTRDFSIMKQILVDREVEDTLAEQGHSLDSVPLRDAEVALRRWWRHANDGWGLDVTADVHPENRAMLERAVRLMSLDVAGVDFVTPDIGRPWYEVGGAINEVNPTPGLNTHVKAGTPDIYKILLEAHFPAGDNGAIPSALVIQGDDDPRLGRWVAGILQGAGHAVGLAQTGSVEIDGHATRQEALPGPDALQQVLGDPLVTAAVSVATDRTILAQGLGLARFDVCALRPHASRRLFDDAPSWADSVRRLLLAAAARRLVVAVDDALVETLDPGAAEVPLCWVSPRADHPVARAGLAAGGSVVTWGEADGRTGIVLLDGTEATLLAPLGAATKPGEKDDPAAQSDRLFAAAIAQALSVAPAEIAKGIGNTYH